MSSSGRRAYGPPCSSWCRAQTTIGARCPTSSSPVWWEPRQAGSSESPASRKLAPVAASINNLSPFISTGLAILVLGERVTLPILMGTLVIVLGTVLLSVSGKQVGFRVRHLVYPFLSASCFGVVAVIRKLGEG